MPLYLLYYTSMTDYRGVFGHFWTKHALIDSIPGIAVEGAFCREEGESFFFWGGIF